MAKMVNELNLRDVSFLNLMQRRIFNVLIVANPYDAFMLEDDGRVDEKIFSEYMQLGLRYPPVFKQVSTIDEAAATLSGTQYDLVICMPGNADNDAFDVARAVKSMSPDIPCVVLTPFSHGISRRMQDLDLSIFDYIFCWLGNTELILSIIKLIEDRMNVDNDTREADVKCVLLVEDNIRFYSSILPNLYKYILTQSLNFATEALNSQAEMLRMRGRPKVLLARSYEEAWQLYQQYKDNMLGVISDCRYPHNGETDPKAGLTFLKNVREQDEFLPLILETSETDIVIDTIGVRMLDKNSKKFNVDLKHILEEHFGFGDFLFRSRTDDERFAAFFFRVVGNFLCERNVVHVLSHIGFGNVSRVNHGFCGEQEKPVHVLLFLFGKFKPSHGHFFFQPVKNFFEYIRFDFILFVARFDHSERLVITLLNCFDVGENKFEIDYPDISYRVHGVFHVRNVFVLETSHNVNDRVHLSYVRKEFVSESFAFGRALYKPRDIDEFYACRRNFFAVIKRGESGKSFVRNRHHANVRLDGAERKVCRLRACVSDCVEKSGFAHVRQSYYS